MQTQSLLPHSSLTPWLVAPILEFVPSALAIWDVERSSCNFNHAAKQMTGFSDNEFRINETIWSERVHPRDREAYLAFRKELKSGERRITRDYRFSHNRKDKTIRLRESSVSLKNSEGRIGTIISTYTDISDLADISQISQNKKPIDPLVGLIGPLLHEIQNSLQLIQMGIDLVSLDRSSPSGIQGITRGLECLKKMCRDLRELFGPIKDQGSGAPPRIFLEDEIRYLKENLQNHGINVRIMGQGPLPAVQLNRTQFHRVLDRVIEFCQVLLSEGGEMEVEATEKTINGEAYVELKFLGSSTCTLGINENNAFQPFLRINGTQIGLGMAIAQQILRRQQGSISFQKETPQQALITILVKSSTIHPQ